MKKLMFIMIGVLGMSIMSCGNKTAKCEEGCDSVCVDTVITADSIVVIDSIALDTVFAADSI